LPEICAFDVAKESSETFDGAHSLKVNMKVRTILGFLKSLKEGTAIVMESTSNYHERIAKAAFKLGFPVYVLNPRDTAAYRKWTSRRAKTDIVDAKMLHEYAAGRLHQLRRYVPKEARLILVHELLRVRNLMVECRTSIQQSLGVSSGALKNLAGDPCAELTVKIDRFEDLVAEFMKDHEGFRRLKKVPGFQTIGAAAMVCAYSSGEFRKVDSFIAFLGLDVYVCQSGKFVGRCKLTKRGCPLWRKILFLGAGGASHSHAFQGYYFNLIERNLPRLAALVALSRKLAKTAWSILRHETDFDPLRVHLQTQQIGRTGVDIGA
jgi:transposase